MDSMGILPTASIQGVQALITYKGDADGEPEDPKDIYRGDPATPRSRPTSPVASAYSWSSSGWSGLGLRRGALRVILEKAISRWARATSGSSTTSSTSSSLHSRRRKRRPSIATSHTTHTEAIFRARRQAWEQGRGTPREFLLFLPAVLAPQLVGHSQDRRNFRSASLPLVLSQLDSAIKRTAKPRRNRNPSFALGKQSSVLPSQTLRDKGKSRESPPMRNTDGNPGSDKSQRRPAW